DYRSQGQTLPFVFVDIATPPSGGLSLFNYMSHFRRKVHDPALPAEDDRLEELNARTKEWWGRMSRG
ncbi:hypothetical protein DFH09DRAFT_851102, partial [Mycena vulgaris]